MKKAHHVNGPLGRDVGERGSLDTLRLNACSFVAKVFALSFYILRGWKICYGCESHGLLCGASLCTLHSGPLHFAQWPFALHCDTLCPGYKPLRQSLLHITAAVLLAADSEQCWVE